MPFLLEVLAAAEEDALLAATRYEKLVSGLGERFLAQIDTLIENLLENPHAYQVKYRDAKGRAVRWANLSRFPYQVIYRIKKGKVILLRVRYAGRSPTTRPGLRSRPT